MRYSQLNMLEEQYYVLSLTCKRVEGSADVHKIAGETPAPTNRKLGYRYSQKWVSNNGEHVFYVVPWDHHEMLTASAFSLEWFMRELAFATFPSDEMEMVHHNRSIFEI